MRELFRRSFLDAAQVMARFSEDEGNGERLDRIFEILWDALEAGGKVLVAGNGGSMADGLHFAEECTGRFRRNRKALAVMALGEACHASCVGNDFGFEEVFARQVEAFGRPGDVLIALSTSGCSANLLRAAEFAQTIGLKVVSFLGKEGKLAGLSDEVFAVPDVAAERVQEIHMLCLHCLAAALDERLCAEKNS